MWVGDVDSGKDVIHRPQMVNWLSAVHHNYQSTLPSKEVDQKLEEGIDGKSLGTLACYLMQPEFKITS